MDTVDPMRFILAFVFVLGLLGLFSVVLKRFGQNKKLFGGAQEGGRLSVVETKYLDHKRRLVLVKCDGVEHLLLLGDGRETVIESFTEKEG